MVCFKLSGLFTLTLLVVAIVATLYRSFILGQSNLVYVVPS